MGGVESTTETKAPTQFDGVTFVKEKISKQPCVVFSKTSCGYCVTARKLLLEAGGACEIIELDRVENGQQIGRALIQLTGQMTVPNIFIGGKTIGGANAVENLFHHGQLVEILRAAGALKGGTEKER